MIIGNRKMFFVSISFFIIIVSLNIPFPHKGPFAEATLGIMNIPIRSSNGVHFLGLFSVSLLFFGIYFLVNSLERYHFRFVILSLVICIMLPHGIVNLYQNTIAKGIYAVDYKKNFSTCDFTMKDDKTMKVICVLPFKNLGNDRVNFNLSFSGVSPFEGEFNLIPLMNKDAPYSVVLQRNERKEVKLNFEMDVSSLNNFTSGSESSVNIQISQGTKVRNL